MLGGVISRAVPSPGASASSSESRSSFGWLGESASEVEEMIGAQKIGSQRFHWCHCPRHCYALTVSRDPVLGDSEPSLRAFLEWAVSSQLSVAETRLLSESLTSVHGLISIRSQLCVRNCMLSDSRTQYHCILDSSD